jgi:hypothetical protein
MNLEIGRQGILISFMLLFSGSAVSQTGFGYKYVFDEGLPVFTMTPGDRSVTIDYKAGELNISGLTNDFGTWYRLAIPGHLSSFEAGKPEIPVLCRLIEVPDGFEYTVSISDLHSEKIVPSSKRIKGLLYPAQESQPKNLASPQEKFSFDKNSYSATGLISSDTVSIKPIGTSGGRKLAGLYIQPVRYSAKGNFIVVITSMKITINYSTGGKSGSSLLPGQAVRSVRTLEKSSLDFDLGSVIPGYSAKPVKMVVLTDTIFRKQLQPYFKWKTQKGFNLKILYRGAALAGATYAQLKDTIAQIYRSGTADDPPPQYLLIIGDITRIPRCDETSNISDLYYGEFDGDGDYLPEIYIGRLPVTDTAEARNVVSKIVQYEKFQFADTNKFYTRALISAGNDPAYQTNMNGQLNYALQNYLNSSNNIEEYHFYYPQSGDAGVEDSVKMIFRKGIGFVNYTGHGDASGWLDPVLRAKDVDSLKNKNMYPFMITNACRTSQFSSSSSLGNRMVLSRDKGAVGYIGCSNDSYWDEDYFWAVGAGTVTVDPIYQAKSLGAYDRLFHRNGESPSDWYITMGQINYAGNLSVSASTSARKKYYWETYNLIGDPSVIPVIGKPGTFTMALPDTIPDGMKLLSVSGEPFSYIAVSHADTLWDASHLSTSGSAELNLPGLSNDSCLIVVSGQNKIPLIKTVRIGRIKGEYLSLASYTINDSQGNNNKKVDSGETFKLDMTVSNLGMTSATGVYAKITSSSVYLNIANDSVYIGTLSARSDKSIASQFPLTVSGDIPDLSIITVDLMLKDSKTEKHYKIDICVHAPDLVTDNCVINDSLSGNRNNSADPGETFYLMFRIMNQGSSGTSGHFYVTSGSPYLTILDNDIETSVLNAGSPTFIPVKVRLNDTPSNGEYINVSSLLDCSPYLSTGEFTFRVGKLRESFESLNFNSFPWINIDKVPWTITGKDHYDGITSARSGAVTHLGKTSLVIRTFYQAEDSVRFFYKVSSEPAYDNMVFKINDSLMLTASGEHDWTRAAFRTKEGINRLEWSYSKDQSVSNGYDAAWLDLIDFAGSVPVSYIRNDIQVARIVSPVHKSRYGQENVTVKVLNLGRDTVKGFNLAYTVNNSGLPVTQKFDNILLPLSDSVTVSFSTKTNLSRYGDYNILTYAFNNSDDYLPNDTLRINIENDHIDDSLFVYPNPSSDQLTLFIQTSSSDKVTVSMINPAGQKLYETERDIIAGMNTLPFSDIDLPSGIYFLRIKGTSFDRTLHVIRLRKK